MIEIIYIHTHQTVITLKRCGQDEARIHTSIHVYRNTPLNYRSGFQRVRSVMQIHNRLLMFSPATLYLTDTFSLPAPDTTQGSHLMGVNQAAPRVVKAASFLLHSPLLSIYFHHALPSLLALQTCLFHSRLFLHRPSILFMTFPSTSYFSYQILLFSSPTDRKQERVKAKKKRGFTVASNSPGLRCPTASAMLPFFTFSMRAPILPLSIIFPPTTLSPRIFALSTGTSPFTYLLSRRCPMSLVPSWLGFHETGCCVEAAGKWSKQREESRSHVQ